MRICDGLDQHFETELQELETKLAQNDRLVVNRYVLRFPFPITNKFSKGTAEDNNEMNSDPVVITLKKADCIKGQPGKVHFHVVSFDISRKEEKVQRITLKKKTKAVDDSKATALKIAEKLAGMKIGHRNESQHRRHTTQQG